MEHFKNGQYDDDLTQGSYDDDLTANIDEYDEDFGSGDLDLFGYIDDEDSPLGRLKSIILSIEWEITDDILRQFNEELHDLKGIWAGNKINLIYVQALEKLSRYIYKEKSSAHPNAIKLLLTFYANLEKVVSDETMSEQQKKSLLRNDIDHFEKLKKQISKTSATVLSQETVAKQEDVVEPEHVSGEKPIISDSEVQPESPTDIVTANKQDLGKDELLIDLKAIVYGIDWEITEQDLANLSREVKRLEKQFESSKAKRIFLQGIGSLGAYIKLKRSNAHADAFKLLHSFFVGLETVVRDDLTGQAEKDILMPEVEKFNKFKSVIAETISPEAVRRASDEVEEAEPDYDEGDIQPAFADMPEDVHGFRAEDEIPAEDEIVAGDEVDEYFEDEEAASDPEEGSALANEMENRLDGMFEEPSRDAAVRQLDKDKALQGVNVETEDDDDSEEEPLPEENGELAPALADEDSFSRDESPAVFADQTDDLFEDAESAEPELLGSEVPGVDVEHEADDESDEEPLPLEGDEYAPALAGDPEVGESRKRAEEIEKSDIDSKLDDFFAETPGEKEFELESSGTDSAEEPVDRIKPDSESVREEVEKPEAAFGNDEVDEPDPESESAIAEEPEVGSEAEEVIGKVDDFFDAEEHEVITETPDDALKGVDVETEDDDDSEEEPLPFAGGEIAPALSDDGEIEEESLAGTHEDVDEEPTVEAEEVLPPFEPEDSEEMAGKEAEQKFDELFGVDDNETSQEEHDISALSDEFESESEIDEEKIGGLLDFGGDDLAVSSLDNEEEATELTDIRTTPEEAELEFNFEDDLAEDVEEETQAEQSVDEEQVGEEGEDEGQIIVAPDFETAGFEEIHDDEIEDFPEEIESDAEKAALRAEEDAALEKAQEEEELLALFDDGVEDEISLSKEEGIQAVTGYTGELSEEDIPEMDVDDFATVIEEDTGISSAGSIPTGYPSADELLSQSGEVAGEAVSDEEITHPEGNEDFIVGIEGFEEDTDEEEVVFEAADEGDDSVVSDDQEYQDDDSFGFTLLDDEEYKGKAGQPVIEEELDEQTAESSVEMKAGDSVNSAYIRPQVDEQFQDSLVGMRNCIASLGLEIDSSILESLNSEIEKLRHLWMDRAAEKTFIQLLSTITGHINKFRYEADQEANRLLLSVFDKLELTALGQIDSGEIQDALLNETSKVLQWQARLIERTVVPSDIEGEKAFTEAELTNEEPELLGQRGVDQDFGEGLDDISRQVDAIGDDILMQKVSTVMKAELEQLKNDFHSQLLELKKEILRGSRDG